MFTKPKQELANFKERFREYDETLEKSVIGTLLNFPSLIDECFLTPNDFYSVFWREAFAYMLQLVAKGEKIDMLVMASKLAIEGSSARLADASINWDKAHFIYHCQIIRQKAVARNLANMSDEIKFQLEQGEDVADIMERIEKTLGTLSQTFNAQSTDMFQVMQDTLTYIQQENERARQGTSGITTGFPTLDRILNGGWRDSQLIIVGGRPSMGKTSLAVHFAEQAAISGKSVVFVSLEMTKEQLGLKLLLKNSERDNYEVLTGRNMTTGDWNDISSRAAELSQINLHIADDAELTDFGMIKSLARKMHRKGQCDMLVIDYLGFIKTRLRFDRQDLLIGYFTSELKNLAKELKIPVMLLCQLSRIDKQVKAPEPKLSDLRDSGNIEQDADIVLFPHRPEYYDAEAVDSNGRSWKNRGKIIVAKNREGERNVSVLFETNATMKRFWEEGTAQEQQEPINTF